MADQRTMAELLRAPTEGYVEAIVGQPVGGSKKNLRVLFSLGRILFPNSSMNSSPSRTTNLRNEISNFQQRFDESFHEAWDRYKDLLRACPHHGFIELHQLDTFYHALNPVDQDSLNSVAGGNLVEFTDSDANVSCGSGRVGTKGTDATHTAHEKGKGTVYDETDSGSIPICV
nr:reverse transcriptase domain-containing protein [Tanacetum cinerariifolium]